MNAVFENGIGLREGADVLFNGVKIGRVESMSLWRSGEVDSASHPATSATGSVVLHLSLDRKYQAFITNRSVAFALRDKNLVSDRVVNIETPASGGRTLDNGDTIAVAESRDIETVLSGLTRLMGKMDDLIHNLESLVRMSRSPNSTVGALLGSRDLYDRLLHGVENVDLAVGEGRQVMRQVNEITDSLHLGLTGFLSRADTISGHLSRTAAQAETLSLTANRLADKGEVVLSRVDDLLKDGAGKMDDAGQLITAVSGMWPVKGKMPKPPEEFPLLLNEVSP